MVSRLQNLRKDTGLEVTDRIEVLYAGEEPVATALEEHREYIMQETLADSLERAEEVTGEVIELPDGGVMVLALRKG